MWGMAEDSRVTFIIAGVQKGGTTALFDYLAEDPGLSLSQVKETHFFDDETQDWAAPDYDAYHANFGRPDGRPRGEATPAYVYWPSCLERIAAYNSDMRLILVLRDPIERAWSHWRMEYARGAETSPFAACIREGRHRLFRTDPFGYHREFSYVERGYYGEQVERLLGLFRRDQLLILRSEDLRRDPITALAKARGFLGVPNATAPQPRDVHVGREMDYGAEPTEADIAHLKGLYARDLERLADLTGIRFG
jgi:hypothetical protein